MVNFFTSPEKRKKNRLMSENHFTKNFWYRSDRLIKPEVKQNTKIAPWPSDVFCSSALVLFNTALQEVSGLIDNHPGLNILSAQTRTL